MDLIKKSVALPHKFISRADFRLLTYFLCHIGPRRPDRSVYVNKPLLDGYVSFRFSFVILPAAT